MQTFSNNVVIVLNVDNANRHDLLSAFNFLEEKRIKIPVILKGSYQSSDSVSYTHLTLPTILLV